MFLNARERFLEVALFASPDRVPLAVDAVRSATRKAWLKEGLPANADELDYLNCRECCIGSVNMVSYPQEGREWKPDLCTINLGPIPPFKDKIVKEDDRYRVWIDSLGVTQMGFQDDWKNGWSGFATRVFMDFPVKN